MTNLPRGAYPPARDADFLGWKILQVSPIRDLGCRRHVTALTGCGRIHRSFTPLTVGAVNGQAAFRPALAVEMFVRHKRFLTILMAAGADCGFSEMIPLHTPPPGIGDVV